MTGFRSLAESLERIRATTSKNEKVSLFASYIKGLGPEEAAFAARISVGRPTRKGSSEEAQVGYSTILDVLIDITGSTREKVSKEYIEFGDLGEVAEKLLTSKKEKPLFDEELGLLDVAGSFEKLRSAKGKGSAITRRAIVKSLLLRASPLEAKYLIKVLTGEMRTGFVHGLVEEAVAKAFGASKELVSRAHMLLGDPGDLVEAAARGTLGSVRIEQFRPVNFMLAEPMATPGEIVDHFGKEVYAEYKYDGVRVQIHKLGNEVEIYSRRLEEITGSFPELLEEAEKVGHDFIIDGEAVAFQSGRPLPFQLLQRRLRRLEGVEKAAKAAPVTCFSFDILMLDGEETYQLPLKVRRKKLEDVVSGTGIQLATTIPVRTEEEVSAAFRMSRELGYEGLVLKDPESSYTIGRRGAGWVKLKEELDTLDVVIVAAEYGHGKRAGMISDYTFAVRDRDTLKVVGKAYSGLTDQEIREMTEKLKKITLEETGYARTVKPEVVLEVAFDSIQRSERHNSGYALRFPRIKRIRYDKSVAEIDTLEKVRRIFRSQKVKLDES